MTNRERVRASLAGKPVDRFPVTALYGFYYHMDRFGELSGLPQWRIVEWIAASPERHVEILRRMQDAVPFETINPICDAPPREWRARQEFVERDGKPFHHDRGTDEWSPVVVKPEGHPFTQTANETRHVRTLDDIDRRVRPEDSAARLADGANDYLEAIARAFPDDYVVSGGVVGTIFNCTYHVGLSNLLAMMVEEPAFLDALCKKILAVEIARIRRLAAGGGDALFVDDSLATGDMISRQHYLRFGQPYVREMVAEIHRLGRQAFVAYWGPVADRLDDIAATSADGLLVECSMKGYVNDVAEIVRRVGDRMTVCANIDPVGVLQDGTDAELAKEIRRQVRAGLDGRGFILTIASPITPLTPVARVRRFVELGREIAGDLCAGRPVAA